MKNFHKINIWAVGINLVLFIIPALGMLLMVLLGLTQLLLALGISSAYYRELDKKHKNLLLLYWLLVILDFTGIALMAGIDNFHNDFTVIPFLFLIPACIAFYFVYVTYSITKYFNYEHPAPQY